MTECFSTILAISPPDTLSIVLLGLETCTFLSLLVTILKTPTASLTSTSVSNWEATMYFWSCVSILAGNYVHSLPHLVLYMVRTYSNKQVLMHKIAQTAALSLFDAL